MFKNSQKGFSAIGLFLLILVMFVVMNFAGIFTVPKSEVTDLNKYTVTGAQISEKKGLSISDLKFTSNEPPIPTKEPLRINPTPSENACNHDNGKKMQPSCDCHVWIVTCQNRQCVKVRFSGETTDRPCDETFHLWCNSNQMTGEGDGDYCIGKPVIYLYPEFPMLVDVRVITSGKVVISDPKIEDFNGWTNVLAHPNGVLFYKEGVYRELFYETETQDVTPPKKGFVVSREELETKLLEFIKRLGLTKDDEQKEFMDWWMPRLRVLNSPYFFVSILEKDEKLRLDKVEINPKPDTFIEFIVYFKPLERHEKFEQLKLPPTPKRIGFTAIEWGGVIEPSLHEGSGIRE